MLSRVDMAAQSLSAPQTQCNCKDHATLTKERRFRVKAVARNGQWVLQTATQRERRSVMHT